MKSLVVATGLVLAGTASAFAQYISAGPRGVTVVVPALPAPPVWTREAYPYARHHHHRCHEKAHRLHHYERHAAADGHLSPRERRIIADLRYDLDRTCGRYRWRG